MTVSAGMIDHCASTGSNLVPIWKITSRDGLVAAYAAHTRKTVGRLINGAPLFIFGGTTYLVSPVAATRDGHKIGLDPNNTQLSGVFDDIITRADVEGGRWKLASIVYEYVNYLDLSMGSVDKIVGVTGKWMPYGNVYQVEVLSNSNLLQQQIGEMTSPTDRNAFPAGLAKEGANEVQKILSTATGATFSGTFTNPLTDITQPFGPAAWNISAASLQTMLLALSNMPASGVACSGGPLNTAPILLTFGGVLALNHIPLLFIDDSLATGGTVVAVVVTEGSPSWTVTRNVVSSIDRRHLVIDGTAKEDSWFKYGVIKWTTGANAITPGMEIRDNVGNAIELVLPMPADIAPGNVVTLLAGYDGTRKQMREKFNDMIDFNGEPDLPGLKVIFTYPE